MKRNFFVSVSFLAIVSFLFFCGTASAKVSDFLSGALGAGISVDSIDMLTGIRLYEGLGYNSNLTYATKKKIGILPAGIIVGAGYSSDVEGNQDPLAKVLSLSAGWRNDLKSQNKIKFIVSKSDLRDFFNKSGKGDVVKFKLDSESQIWTDGETHYVDAIFTSSATVPIINDEKWLRGLNAELGLRYKIKADDHLSVFQEIELGVDDGSFGYPPALLLSYKIYAKICAGKWNFQFPRISGIYASENGGDKYNLRRDKEMLCAGCSVEYNFW